VGEVSFPGDGHSEISLMSRAAPGCEAVDRRQPGGRDRPQLAPAPPQRQSSVGGRQILRPRSSSPGEQPLIS
jgi:hypothetical protein